MNRIIEQQKERAREKAIWNDEVDDHIGTVKVILYEEVDTLITETHQATIDEVVRIVKTLRIIGDDNLKTTSNLIDDWIMPVIKNKIIEAITSNKE